MFFSSCETARKINESDMEELIIFINSFYDFLNNDPKPEDVYKYFFNNDIQFYIINTSHYHRFISRNQSTQAIEFIDIINELYYKSKKMKEREIKRAVFVKQVYDVPMSDLFVLDYNVIYEDLEASETFFIKKADKTYKIYRFFINYNKDWGDAE